MVPVLGGVHVAEKERKPYELTKQREYWTDSEHNSFVRALEKYGREWKSIQREIGTKTAVQIRSHAQKYFMKLERTAPEMLARIPPPRARKSRVQRLSSAVSSTGVSTQAAPTMGRVLQHPLRGAVSKHVPRSGLVISAGAAKSSSLSNSSSMKKSGMRSPSPRNESEVGLNAVELLLSAVAHVESESSSTDTVPMSSLTSPCDEQ